MKQEHVQEKQSGQQYKGLPKILHSVRWTQHLLAIIAEVLILASFAMSGMDVSLSGAMTNIAWLKWIWAAAFALGIDTCFIISWVRVRHCSTDRNWGAFSWNVLLALGMSFIVFQPVAIQLLQQSLAIKFGQALGELGINIVLLIYGRALVAVILGAVLALTNVESAMEDKQITTAQAPKRRLAFLEKALNKVAPIVSDETAQPTQPASTPDGEQNVEQAAPKQSAHLHIVKAKPVRTHLDAQPLERVRQALISEPDCSDRKLGRLSGMSAATAKKYRLMLEQERSAANNQ